MVHATSPQPRKDFHLESYPCKHVSNPREANPDESEGNTWTSHGLKATRHPNRLKTKWTPGTDPRTHRIATTRKHGRRWAHKGLADPTGQLNRPCVGSSWPSTWCCLVGSRVHSWGVGGASISCPRPINRREGTHILPNSLSNSSRTFGFQG
jgi:hypothetical protein